MEAIVIERLGSPEEIADSAAREFRRRRNWWSRSRLAAFCTFVLLPLPALCVAWAAALAGLVAVGSALEWLSPDYWPAQEVSGIDVFMICAVSLAIVLAPAAGVAFAFGRLARKRAHHRLWGIAACLLVAIGTGLASVDATFSERPEKNTVVFGLGIGRNFLLLTQLGQFLIPAAVGILTLRRPAAQGDCQVAG